MSELTIREEIDEILLELPGSSTRNPDIIHAEKRLLGLIKRIGESLISNDEELPEDNIENWKYYDDYRVNAYDFQNGMNKLRSEQRTKLKALLEGDEKR